jgi:hypothetical protein
VGITTLALAEFLLAGIACGNRRRLRARAQARFGLGQEVWFERSSSPSGQSSIVSTAAAAQAKNPRPQAGGAAR